MAIVVEGSASNGFTYIVNQHRHPIGQSIWQFPIGGFDSKTEDPVESAKKELLEETGVKAGGMDYLGSFYADPGFTNQKIHVCATNDVLDVGEQQLETTEQGLMACSANVCRNSSFRNVRAPVLDQIGLDSRMSVQTGHFYVAETGHY